MAGLIAVLYGIAAYVVFLAGFLYAIGFTGNVVMRTSIDSGEPGALSGALIIDTLLWKRSRPTVPGQVFARGLAFVFVMAAEFGRAMAATERYEQLRRTARACDDPEASPARRVYVEFYSN